MAENKKGFVLYADQKSLIDKLPDETAGKLIKHIFSYINDENPETDDLLLEIAFEPIKQQLKRDLVKYEEIKEKRKIAGAKGGRPKKQDEAKKAIGSFDNQSKAKKPVRDNVIVKVKDKEINTNGLSQFLNSNSFEDFWGEYPKKTCKADALEFWNNLVGEDIELHENIRKAIEWQKKTGCLKETKYAPKASEWLKAKRWEDEDTVEVQEERKIIVV